MTADFFSSVESENGSFLWFKRKHLQEVKEKLPKRLRINDNTNGKLSKMNLL